MNERIGDGGDDSRPATNCFTATWGNRTSCDTDVLEIQQICYFRAISDSKVRLIAIKYEKEILKAVFLVRFLRAFQVTFQRKCSKAVMRPALVSSIVLELPLSNLRLSVANCKYCRHKKTPSLHCRRAKILDVRVRYQKSEWRRGGTVFFSTD